MNKHQSYNILLVLIFIYACIAGCIYAKNNPLYRSDRELKQLVGIFTFQKVDKYQVTYDNLKRIYPEAFRGR